MYDQAVDIWSLGCVVGELLNNSNTKSFQKCQIFPGKYCHLLSPSDRAVDPKYDIGQGDQIREILKVIGPLSVNDRSFVTDKKNLRYLEELEISIAKTRKCGKFEKMFKSIKPELKDLLKKMLNFNPYNRITTKQALNSPIFDHIRVPYFEKPCPIQIKHELFEPDAFNYKTGKS